MSRSITNPSAALAALYKHIEEHNSKAETKLICQFKRIPKTTKWLKDAETLTPEIPIPPLM